jgi:hypothetical protein
MKDDKPKGKSQKAQSGRGVSDSKLPSFQKDEEDVDFEILDALEQIEQAGKGEGEGLTDDESNIELTLDDEELVFDEEAEEEGEFQIDEEDTTGLTEELVRKTEEFSLEETFGDNIGEDVHADIEEESFSMNLDQEDEEEMDLDLGEVEMHEETDEVSFDLGEDVGEFDSSEVEAETDEELFETGTDHLEGDLGVEDEEFDLGIDAEGEIEDTSLSDINDLAEFDLDSVEQEDRSQGGDFDFGEDEFDISSSTDFSEVEDLSDQESEIGLDETDETFEEMNLDQEMPDTDDISFETDIGDENVSDMEVADMDLENELDELSGKSVISIDGEQVVDLGDETEFDQEEEFGATESLWEDEEQETDDESFDISEEETDIDLTELEEGARQFVDGAASDLDTEQEDDEEFMASLEDIDIDLEEETTRVLETLEGVDGISEFAEEESSEFDIDNLDITPDEDQEPETPISEEESEEEIDVQALSEILEQSREELDAQERMIASDTPETEGEGVAEAAVPEIDEREELGLAPRLTNSEINQFESMVNEAKTLQRYMEELEEHKTDVKEKIYQKLLKEYTSRKITIFREPDFISIRIDVEQDLQDMLTKRTDFASTIEHLNDELDEVKVRHLVGEYTDMMLAKQEETQKTEITQWHDKTEKIEKFIIRYQELLDTAQELNPLKEEAEEETLPEPEQEAFPPTEEITQAEEAGVLSEEIEQAEPNLPTEEISQEEETIAPAEDTSQEMEVESLLDNLDEVIPDEWEATEEDVEITVETETDQEFSMESIGDEEDYVFDESPDIGEELDEEQPAFEDETVSDETEEDMITCKKCGRSTPASEKFCVNCGAKAQ